MATQIIQPDQQPRLLGANTTGDWVIHDRVRSATVGILCTGGANSVPRARHARAEDDDRGQYAVRGDTPGEQ